MICDHKNAKRIYTGNIWFCPDCEETLVEEKK